LLFLSKTFNKTLNINRLELSITPVHIYAVKAHYTLLEDPGEEGYINVVIVVMVTVVFRLESTSIKKISVFGDFLFSEFRIRDCVPILLQ
jgi:hypothetical protein